MTQFNAANIGYISNKYPLFLGQSLGVVDTINVKYPELEKLYQDQLAQIWNEFEIDLNQDKIEMKTLPKETMDLMVKTIMWQTVADSVAARSIIETLGQHITNTELSNLATLWSFFEVIHARTYSHIIKQTFQAPNEMLEELYADAAVLQRSDIIIKTFDDMANIRNNTNVTTHEIKCQILKTITALFALEAVAFMSSFAVTFAITETGVFQGIGKLVKLICRDEVLHTRMNHSILSILQKDPDWEIAFSETSGDIKSILDAVVTQELTWPDYLFSEGRKVVGLNATILKEYSLFMAKPVYDSLNVEFDYTVITENPLPYMDTYIDPTKVQTANMEIQNGSYLVGAIKDDTSGLDLNDL